MRCIIISLCLCSSAVLDSELYRTKKNSNYYSFLNDVYFKRRSVIVAIVPTEIPLKSCPSQYGHEKSTHLLEWVPGKTGSSVNIITHFSVLVIGTRLRLIRSGATSKSSPMCIIGSSLEITHIEFMSKKKIWKGLKGWNQAEKVPLFTQY